MAYATEKYRDYTIEIDHDDIGQNPRTDFDNLGTMVCFHSRYELGDKDTGISKDELVSIMNSKDYISLPLYLYDHSGITMNTTGFSCKWDSGMVGAIFVSKEKAREEFGCKRINKKIIERVNNVLKGEVTIYDQMLTGQIFGYNIKDKNNEDTFESCGGFYGDDFENNGLFEYAKNNIDYLIKQEEKNGVQMELEF